MNTKRIGAAVALVAALGAGGWWWVQQQNGGKVEYRTATVSRGNLQATVAASGAVSPVAQVSVGTQVSGQIRDVLVDFNSEVKAGQLIAQIDPETFEYRVRSAQADVDAARAAVLTAQANALAAQTQVSRAQVDLDEARRDSDRKKSLADQQFIAASEADKARALVNTSLEAMKSVQAQVGVAQAQVKTAQANVAQREAALAQAVDVLSRAGVIHVVGMRRAFPVASYLAYVFEKMQVPAMLHDGVGKLDHRFALRKGDYEPIHAGDAREAQTAIADRVPDLILLDWMLPGTSGLELARRWRKAAPASPCEAKN